MTLLQSFLDNDYYTFFSQLEKTSDSTQFHNIFTQLPRYIDYRKDSEALAKQLFNFLDKMNLTRLSNEVKHEDLKKFIKMLDTIHDEKSLALLFDAIDDKKIAHYAKVNNAKSVEVILKRAAQTKNYDIINEVINKLEDKIIEYNLFNFLPLNTFNYQSLIDKIEKNQDKMMLKNVLVNFPEKTLNYIHYSINLDIEAKNIKYNLFLLDAAFGNFDALNEIQKEQLKINLKKASDLYLDKNVMKNFDLISTFSEYESNNKVYFIGKLGSLKEEYKILLTLLDKHVTPLESTLKEGKSLLSYILNEATLFHYQSHTPHTVIGRFSSSMADALIAYMSINQKNIMLETGENLVKLYLKNHTQNKYSLHQFSYYEELNPQVLEFLYKVSDKELYQEDFQTPFDKTNDTLKKYAIQWSKNYRIHPINQFVELLKEIFHLDTANLINIDDLNFNKKKRVFSVKLKNSPLKDEVNHLFINNKNLAKVVENKFFEKEKIEFHHLLGQKLLGIIDIYLNNIKQAKEENKKEINDLALEQIKLIKEQIQNVKKTVVHLAKAKPEEKIFSLKKNKI
jgi:hypothetical protein